MRDVKPTWGWWAAGRFILALSLGGMFWWKLAHHDIEGALAMLMLFTLNWGLD